MNLLNRVIVFVAIILRISHPPASAASCPEKCKTAVCNEIDGGCPNCKDGWFGRHCQYPLECYTGRGFTYNGTMSVTENNITCQHWKDNEPNNHTWTESLATSVNFCRNPNVFGIDPKPWCYQMQGDRFALCNISKCEDQCPSPKLGVYGDVINPPSSGFYVGLIMEIICGLGKKESIVCQSNKTWATHLECSAPTHCTKPVVTEPGYIDTLKSKFYYKDVLVISCREGYEIVGNNTIRCNEDKTWSKAPNCQPVPCKQPVLTEHTIAISPKASYVYKDSINLTCSKGYELKHNNTITCQANMTWNAIPVCTAVPCKQPVLTEHTIAISPKASYVYKDSINLTCSKGYELKHNNTITCQANMTWNAIPVCTAVACPEPQLTANSMIIDGRKTKYVYQDKIMIACRDGSYLTNILKATCLHSATWEEFNCPELSSDTTGLSSDVIGLAVGTAVSICIAMVAVGLSVYSLKLLRNNPMAMRDAITKPAENSTYDNLRLSDIGADKSAYELY